MGNNNFPWGMVSIVFTERVTNMRKGVRTRSFAVSSSQFEVVEQDVRCLLVATLDVNAEAQISNRHLRAANSMRVRPFYVQKQPSLLGTEAPTHKHTAYIIEHEKTAYKH